MSDLFGEAPSIRNGAFSELIRAHINKSGKKGKIRAHIINKREKKERLELA